MRTRTKLGLAGLAGIALLGAMPTQARGGDYGWLSLENTTTAPGVSTPDVQLYLYPGTSAGYDDGDTKYPDLTGSRLDFYSRVPGYNLTEDIRPPEAVLNFDILMQASGITALNSNLVFNMHDPTYWEGNPLIANIYDKNNDPFMTNIDVWAYSSSKTPIDIPFNSSGDSYTINISTVPEPGTVVGLAGLAAVGLGAYAWKRRKSRNGNVQTEIDEPYFSK